MKKQNGFTLIELVVVIAILGILAAIALPKFVDFTSDARKAKLQGAQAAVNAASALAHAKYLAGGSTAATISAEASTIDLAFGYPVAKPTTNSGIAVAAGLSSSDYSITYNTAGDTVTIADSTKTTCLITYKQATSTSVPPVIDATALNTASNC